MRFYPMCTCGEDVTHGCNCDKTRETSKPPLGIVPRKIWEDKRLEEIKSAILRYIDSRHAIPLEWVEEYNELIERLR